MFLEMTRVETGSNAAKAFKAASFQRRLIMSEMLLKGVLPALNSRTFVLQQTTWNGLRQCFGALSKT